MKVTKEDLQYVRQYIAEKHGKEMTPAQVLEVMREVKKIEVVDEPGLATILRQDGNNKGHDHEHNESDH
jgi:hypothetical protein